MSSPFPVLWPSLLLSKPAAFTDYRLLSWQKTRTFSGKKQSRASTLLIFNPAVPSSSFLTMIFRFVQFFFLYWLPLLWKACLSADTANMLVSSFSHGLDMLICCLWPALFHTRMWIAVGLGDGDAIFHFISCLSWFAFGNEVGLLPPTKGSLRAVHFCSSTVESWSHPLTCSTSNYLRALPMFVFGFVWSKKLRGPVGSCRGPIRVPNDFQIK